MGSVSTQNVSEPRAILVLHDTLREKSYFKARLSDLCPQSQVYTLCVNRTEDDMLPAFNECCKLIENHNISVVINRPEVGSLVHAALCAKYSLPGPSVLSTFLTISKRLTRELIGEPLQLNIPYTVIESSDSDKLQQGLMALPSGSKIIAKPVFESGSKCLRVLERKEDALEEDFLASLADIRGSHLYLLCHSMFSAFLPGGCYSFEQGYMLEQYIEKDPDVASFHGVDGLIYKKTLLPWCIRDHLYWRGRRECHIGNAFPSSLPTHTQARVWEVVASIADKLIQYGYDCQFFEAELIVFKTGRIAIMEINGRLPLTMSSKAYTSILNRGDTTATILAMAEDQLIEPPTLKPGLHGLFAYVPSLTDAKVSDVIDIDKVGRNDNVELLRNPDEFVKAADTSAGVNLACVNMTGTSRQACLEQAKELILDFTKNKQNSPWQNDEYLIE